MMPVEAFDRAHLVPAPWRNGGGVTREIVRRPAGAGLDAFDWRVSIATIAADGPFSTFAGIERVLILLAGGVGLRSDDGEIDHRLDTPLAPFVFDGEKRLTCTLLAGESTDLNVMVRRGVHRTDVCVLNDAHALGACERGLLFAVRGRWKLRARRRGPAGVPAAAVPDLLAPDAGVWWDAERIAWRVTPLGADPRAALLVVRLWPYPGRRAA
jgi:environmental stress-induced protein Ves